MSGGSRATVTSMALAPGFSWRGGRLVDERASARVGRFDVGGRRRRGISFGTSEALSLPRLYPRLERVETYWGWFDEASRLAWLGSLALSVPGRIQPVRRLIERVDRRLAASAPPRPADPDSGSLFVAEALSAEGECLSQVVFEGINGYEFSGRMLAWAAGAVAAGEVKGRGALGPVEAFGTERLEEGVAACGVGRVR